MGTVSYIGEKSKEELIELLTKAGKNPVVVCCFAEDKWFWDSTNMSIGQMSFLLDTMRADLYKQLMEEE